MLSQGVAAGAGRAGQAEDWRGAGDAGGGARLDRRGADPGRGRRSGTVSRSRSMCASNSAVHRLRRDVAAGREAGAACGDDHVHRLGSDRIQAGTGARIPSMSSGWVTARAATACPVLFAMRSTRVGARLFVRRARACPTRSAPRCAGARIVWLSSMPGMVSSRHPGAAPAKPA